MQIPVKKIKVLVYDDQDVFREGIVEILKSEERFIVREVSDPSKFFTRVDENRPDVIITCVQSKEPDIAQLIQNIERKYPKTAVLTVSTFPHVHDVVRMLRAGATGCLLRNANRTEVIRAINDMHLNGYYYSQQVVDKLASLLKKAELPKFHLELAAQLSEKDKKFIRYLCKGYSMKRISAETGLFVYTLEYKKRQLYFRLNTDSVAGLINYAIVNGLHNPFGFSC